MASADSTWDAPHAYARLRKAMAPDPSLWYYTGKVNDTGEYGESNCACGHEVRYEFIIACKGDTRTLIIGSTCIEKNVPSLIQDGAGRLAEELDEARLKLQRDLASERRDLEAAEALAELHSDFRRLRNWCFARRKEWLSHERYGGLPKVLNWIEKPPEEDEDEGPSHYTAAIRKRYVSMWLKAAEVFSEHQELFAQAAPMPIPVQRRLLTQLANAVQRTAKNLGASNHDGAVLAYQAPSSLPVGHSALRSRQRNQAMETCPCLRFEGSVAESLLPIGPARASWESAGEPF